MRREDLDALGLSETAAEAVLALAGQEREALEQQGRSALEQERSAHRQARAQWDSERDSLLDRLEARQRAEATRLATGELRFTSESAKQCFLQQLEQAALPLEDGKLAGFAEFAAAFREKDPSALWGDGQAPLFALAGGGAAGEDEALRRAFGL